MVTPSCISIFPLFAVIEPAANAISGYFSNVQNLCAHGLRHLTDLSCVRWGHDVQALGWTWSRRDDACVPGRRVGPGLRVRG
jgi:hypothetical protein